MTIDTCDKEEEHIRDSFQVLDFCSWKVTKMKMGFGDEFCLDGLRSGFRYPGIVYIVTQIRR